jgi:hypothetical protein
MFFYQDNDEVLNVIFIFGIQIPKQRFNVLMYDNNSNISMDYVFGINDQIYH